MSSQRSGVKGQKSGQGATVYLHIFRPVAHLAVRGFTTPVQAARVLATGAPVPFTQDGTAVTLELPPAQLLPQVVALEFTEPPRFVACANGWTAL